MQASHQHISQSTSKLKLLSRWTLLLWPSRTSNSLNWAPQEKMPIPYFSLTQTVISPIKYLLWDFLSYELLFSLFSLEMREVQQVNMFSAVRRIVLSTLLIASSKTSPILNLAWQEALSWFMDQDLLVSIKLMSHCSILQSTKALMMALHSRIIHSSKY